MADVYESVLCIKQEVFVYRIPARATNRGYRAAEWKLDEPDWTGRLKVVSKDRDLSIKLEDKSSGELFAQCPVEAYPSIAVEQVLDSSRYFVLRIQDGTGRNAFIGIGFADRGDSFDLMVAIQDHFKEEKEIEETSSNLGSLSLNEQHAPKLNLGFKEGQTIKLNFATKKTTGDNTSTTPTSTSSKTRTKAGGAVLLPPPPGGVKIQGPPRPSPTLQDSSLLINSNMVTTCTTSSSDKKTVASNIDLLIDLDPIGTTTGQTANNNPFSAGASDVWQDFARSLNVFSSTS
ncbi:hypothetical protein HELRODRAFT_68489 [Helobdella robusta]|uniref:NECAP PHear domain-containing protein n=1 Tax=Helobdella robusta TaxID=6412 RepID=T1FZF4_HELRO|nr:hypothetical protein HELRODRAFT_68489 [Helobdella robusta]ESN96060.1 hypothetical protein HELRODRAFT_68489 [Helobdella robusta]